MRPINDTFKNRAYFEHLFHAAPVGIVLLDTDDTILDCNVEFTRIFQFTREQSKGKKINDLIVPQHLCNEASNLSEKIFYGQQIYHETVRKRKDGSLVNVAITGRPVITPRLGKIAIYGMYQDITERKQHEAELQRQLAFRELTFLISSEFTTSADINDAINHTLNRIGNLTQASRAYVFFIDEDETTVSNTHEWCMQGVEAQIQNLQRIPLETIPWWINKLKMNEPIVIDNVAMMSSESSTEKEMLESQGIVSLLVLPLWVEKRLRGFIGFDFLTEHPTFSDLDFAALKLSAEFIGHALHRENIRHALMHERDLLQAIMDNIPDAIYFKDLSGRFTRINQAMAGLIGVKKPGEAIGKTDANYFDPDYARSSFVDEKQLFEKGIAVIQKQEYGHTRGTGKWLITSKLPLRNQHGVITGLVGISHDITRQKETEIKLVRKEQFLIRLNEIISLSLRTSDIQSLSRLLSEHVKNLLVSDLTFVTFWDDQKKEIFLVTGIENISNLPKEKLQQIKPFIERVVNSDTPIIDDDLLSQLTTHVSLMPLHVIRSMLSFPLIADESRLGSLHIGFKSVHHFSSDEIEFGKLAANQIALVISKIKMLDELTLHKKELSKLVAEKEKLITVIAHDLRSPFISLLGLTEMISDERIRLTTDEITTITEAIHQSATNLHHLINELLEWSLLQHGAISPKFEKLLLNNAVEQVIESLKPTLTKKQLLLNFKIKKDIEIEADANMLRSLISNLVGNAIKFTSRGGTITIDCRNEADCVVLIIQDSGIGMTEEIAKNLFCTDNRITTPGTEGEPSTGFGLLLYKEFVNKHNGNIWIESQPGVGSTFYVSLPKFSISKY